jgi:hypothetical protein
MSVGNPRSDLLSISKHSNVGYLTAVHDWLQHVTSVLETKDAPDIENWFLDVCDEFFESIKVAFTRQPHFISRVARPRASATTFFTFTLLHTYRQTKLNVFPPCHRELHHSLI